MIFTFTGDVSLSLTTGTFSVLDIANRVKGYLPLAGNFVEQVIDLDKVDGALVADSVVDSAATRVFVLGSSEYHTIFEDNLVDNKFFLFDNELTAVTESLQSRTNIDTREIFTFAAMLDAWPGGANSYIRHINNSNNGIEALNSSLVLLDLSGLTEGVHYWYERSDTVKYLVEPNSSSLSFSLNIREGAEYLILYGSRWSTSIGGFYCATRLLVPGEFQSESSYIFQTKEVTQSKNLLGTYILAPTTNQTIDLTLYHAGYGSSTLDSEWIFVLDTSIFHTKASAQKTSTRTIDPYPYNDIFETIFPVDQTDILFIGSVFFEGRDISEQECKVAYNIVQNLKDVSNIAQVSKDFLGHQLNNRVDRTGLVVFRLFTDVTRVEQLYQLASYAQSFSPDDYHQRKESSIFICADTFNHSFISQLEFSGAADVGFSLSEIGTVRLELAPTSSTIQDVFFGIDGNANLALTSSYSSNRVFDHQGITYISFVNIKSNNEIDIIDTIKFDWANIKQIVNGTPNDWEKLVALTRVHTANRESLLFTVVPSIFTESPPIPLEVGNRYDQETLERVFSTEGIIGHKSMTIINGIDEVELAVKSFTYTPETFDAHILALELSSLGEENSDWFLEENISLKHLNSDYDTLDKVSLNLLGDGSSYLIIGTSRYKWDISGAAGYLRLYNDTDDIFYDEEIRFGSTAGGQLDGYTRHNMMVFYFVQLTGDEYKTISLDSKASLSGAIDREYTKLFAFRINRQKAWAYDLQEQSEPYVVSTPTSAINIDLTRPGPILALTLARVRTPSSIGYKGYAIDNFGPSNLPWNVPKDSYATTVGKYLTHKFAKHEEEDDGTNKGTFIHWHTLDIDTPLTYNYGATFEVDGTSDVVYPLVLSLLFTAEKYTIDAEIEGQTNLDFLSESSNLITAEQSVTTGITLTAQSETLAVLNAVGESSIVFSIQAHTTLSGYSAQAELVLSPVAQTYQILLTSYPGLGDLGLTGAVVNNVAFNYVGSSSFSIDPMAEVMITGLLISNNFIRLEVGATYEFPIYVGSNTLALNCTSLSSVLEGEDLRTFPILIKVFK